MRCSWTNTTKWMFIMLFQLVAKAMSLKDLKINVPEAVASGDTVIISCHYDLENAALYSVRWYFDQEEFYRYVPKESPPSRVFPISGVIVDLLKSGENTVTLKSVSRSQSGHYQCEVSADAPLFHTETQGANLLVAELPDSEPVMTVYGMPAPDSKRIVAFGETFKTSCVSGPSYPSVNFTWIVNGIRYPSTHSGLRDIGQGHSWESKEAWSELIILVDNQIVSSNRKLVVRCETNIYTVYRGAAEVELQVMDDNFWINGGKVSPTIDQRGGSKRGDPEYSGLTGSAIFLFSVRYYLFRLAILWFIIFLVS
ncbi:uncharacterized protein LOC119085909 [Bradysia coprophila]|uniref:uncharacterized protein LOC119085909 n=1 Tax=Bradysia coprophila TaxID=38358 RepID=UPI00187DC09E|nr:uncharacterized protein LOC119085909 [Bradysia coprophila]XP_037052362.1 uncharacterized protein LOC119085909 [Bradysia coprophila]